MILIRSTSCRLTPRVHKLAPKSRHFTTRRDTVLYCVQYYVCLGERMLSLNSPHAASSTSTSKYYEMGQKQDDNQAVKTLLK